MGPLVKGSGCLAVILAVIALLRALGCLAGDGERRPPLRDRLRNVPQAEQSADEHSRDNQPHAAE